MKRPQSKSPVANAAPKKKRGRPPAERVFPNRMAEVRERCGLSRKAAAEKIGLSDEHLRKLEIGERGLHVQWMTRAATVYGVQPGDLLNVSPDPSKENVVPSYEMSPEMRDEILQDTIIDIPPSQHMPLTMPVYGVIMGGPGDADFSFNGEISDYVRRPPGLAHAKDAFAVYVVGSSMSPRFEEGEMVFINPARPPRPGDDVIVELFRTNGDRGEPGPCYLKRLVRRNHDYIILKQFNPPVDDIQIPTKIIKHIYRVVTPAELVSSA